MDLSTCLGWWFTRCTVVHAVPTPFWWESPHFFVWWAMVRYVELSCFLTVGYAVSVVMIIKLMTSEALRYEDFWKKWFERIAKSDPMRFFGFINLFGSGPIFHDLPGYFFAWNHGDPIWHMPAHVTNLGSWRSATRSSQASTKTRRIMVRRFNICCLGATVQLLLSNRWSQSEKTAVFVDFDDPWFFCTCVSIADLACSALFGSSFPGKHMPFASMFVPNFWKRFFRQMIATCIHQKP